MFARDFAALEGSLSQTAKTGTTMMTPERMIVELHLTPRLVRRIGRQFRIQFPWFAPAYATLKQHRLLPSTRIPWNDWLKLYGRRRTEAGCDQGNTAKRGSLRMGPPLARGLLQTPLPAMPTPPLPAPNAPRDDRAVFRECGLPYGRCFGSKSAYARTHALRFFVPNACVFTRAKVCVWRGDLDLAIRSDRRGLVRASRRLNRKLFVLREQMRNEVQALPDRWLSENALVTVWRGKVATVGYTRRLHGTLKEVIARSRVSR